MSSPIANMNREPRGTLYLRFIVPVSVTTLAALCLIAFQVGIIFPIWISVVLIAAVTTYLIVSFRNERIGLLILVIWLAFILPFIHIPPYLWFDFSSTPIMMWGLVANPYMTDERVIEMTAMLGAFGALGFALAVSWAPGRVDAGNIVSLAERRRYRTMAIPIWLIWIVVGVALSWGIAPPGTILNTGYNRSIAILAAANFGSAWMMSYIILAYAFCDALLETDRAYRRFKFLAGTGAILFVVGYLQLLRGDRESIPWALTMLLVYYYWGAGITQKQGFRIPWARILLLGGTMIVVSMVLGAIRHNVIGLSAREMASVVGQLYETQIIRVSDLLYGTWSAALLTPLSVAGDYVYGLIDIKYGRDYLDLLLSLPPGFLADAIGYERPLDAMSGPAWEMRYGIGGVHGVVVPFMNFGMPGVLLIPTLWTWLINLVERRALLRMSVTALSLLATLATVAPHWLWYGDKYLVNAVIIWFIMAFFYRVSLALFRVSTTDGIHREAALRARA